MLGYTILSRYKLYLYSLSNKCCINMVISEDTKMRSVTKLIEENFFAHWKKCLYKSILTPFGFFLSFLLPVNSEGRVEAMKAILQFGISVSYYIFNIYVCYYFLGKKLLYSILFAINNFKYVLTVILKSTTHWQWRCHVGCYWRCRGTLASTSAALNGGARNPQSIAEGDLIHDSVTWRFILDAFN